MARLISEAMPVIIEWRKARDAEASSEALLVDDGTRSCRSSRRSSMSTATGPVAAVTVLFSIRLPRG